MPATDSSRALGQALKEARERGRYDDVRDEVAPVRRADLARILDVQRSTITRWEDGGTAIGREVEALFAYARALGVPLTSIAGRAVGLGWEPPHFLREYEALAWS